MNADSTLLHQQAQLRAQAQLAMQLIEQQHYQEHGRLVPDMPTDDGATLRRAILSEDCIKDLVRPLRSAGWSVEVSDPEATGLYMTVVADCKRSEPRRSAALQLRDLERDLQAARRNLLSHSLSRRTISPRSIRLRDLCPRRSRHRLAAAFCPGSNSAGARDRQLTYGMVGAAKEKSSRQLLIRAPLLPLA